MGSGFIEQYKNDKNQLQIIYNFQQNITLPNSTICFSLEIGELLPNTTYSSGRPILNDDIYRYFHNLNMSKESLLEGNWPTNCTLLNTIHSYLAFLAKSEASDSSDLTLRSSSEDTTPYFLTDSEISTDLYSAMLFLEHEIRKLNITTNELKQSFGKTVAVILALNVTVITRNEVNGLSGEMEMALGITASINNESICHRIPFDRFPFGSRQLTQFISIAVSDKDIPSSNYNGEECNLRYQIHGLVYSNFCREFNIDFSGGNNTGIESSVHQIKDVVGYFAIQKNISIVLDKIYSPLPTDLSGKLRCSEEISMENCRATCRLKSIQNLCNCTATSWPWLDSPSHQRECRLTDYENCLNFSAAVDSDCFGNCLDLCERRTYRTATILQLIGLYEFNADHVDITGIGLQLQVIKFDYTIFEEQPAWTFNTISASLGNVLSFYLGLDFLTIIELMVVNVLLVVNIIYSWWKNGH